MLMIERIKWSIEDIDIAIWLRQHNRGSWAPQKYANHSIAELKKMQNLLKLELQKEEAQNG